MMTSEQSQAPGAVEVVLYINPAAPTSAKARRNLDLALRDYDAARYRLIVRDVTRDLAESEADHVVFTPTLIVRHPQALCTLVGDLEDNATVVAILSMGGMEKSG
jgi:hypothetical protein